MGNTCSLMADSSQCMAKPVQYCKVKFKKKKKKAVRVQSLVMEGFQQRVLN